MEGTEKVRNEITRRQALKRVGAVGAIAWATPVITSLNQRAFAASAGGGSAPIYKDSDAYTCPTGAGITTTPTGTVSISATATLVTVSASVSGLSGTATYDMWLNQDPGGCPLSVPTVVGWLVTDGSGTGSAGPTLVPRVVGATVAWISLVRTSPLEVHRSAHRGDLVDVLERLPGPDRGGAFASQNVCKLVASSRLRRRTVDWFRTQV